MLPRWGKVSTLPARKRTSSSHRWPLPTIKTENRKREVMTTNVTSPVTPERIMQFAWGYVPPLVLEAAIRHRVFDVLDSGPKTLSEVQKESGASQRGLAAVMNALVGMGLLAKDKQGVFSLTPESSAFLVSTKPGFQGGLLLHGSEQLIPKWLHLNRIVETGRP